MKIVRNEERRKRFLADLRKEVNSRPRKGLHVTSVLHPLVAFWSRVKPRPHDENAALFFLVGNSLHGHIEPYFAQDPNAREVRVKYKDVLGTMDAIDFDDVVVEIKGTRKRLVKKKPEDSYIEQLMAYCAMMDRPTGRIVTLYISPAGYVPDVAIDDVTFTEAELKEMRVRLETNAQRLKLALETKDPRVLPLCPRSMCTYCRWNDVCPGSARLEGVEVGEALWATARWFGIETDA